MEHLQVHATTLTHVTIDTTPPSTQTLYVGMPVMITRNINKTHGVVNGQRGTLLHLRGNNLEMELESRRHVFVHPVSVPNPDGGHQHLVIYPIVPAYAFTICKAQGQTLHEVVIYFDVDTVPCGSAYVAVTRVRRLSTLFFLTEPKPVHFKPVSF